MQCPLCRSGCHQLTLSGQGERTFHRCGYCELVTVDSRWRLSLDAEKAHYLKHKNDRANEGYVAFLNKGIGALADYCAAPARGIDFGCGYNPVSSELLRERGYHVCSYDPFFAPDTQVLEESYDFLLAVEVVEHFHHPLQEFARIDSLLLPGGIAVVMTLLYEEPGMLSHWWYLRDKTHCSVYSPASIKWLARHFGWEVLSVRELRTIAFRKQ